MYAYGFRFYFTPLTGVLFAFPSRYWFTIGRWGIFSLGGWSPRIPTGFHVSRSTWDTSRAALRFRLRGSHPLWPIFPDRSATAPPTLYRGPATPDPVSRTRFGLFPVRSPLLGESSFPSLPRGTEMFQFPRFASRTLCIQARTSGHYPTQVPPFGHPRIDACLRLPGAYRSLPRPSSLPSAKASTVRP